MGKLAKISGVIYLIFLSLMLLHPNPWSLFGFLRERVSDVSRFSLLHFAIFVLLGIIVEGTRGSRPRIGVLLVGLIYACTIELVQPLTGRHFELLDLIQNVSGFLVGFFAFAMLKNYFCKKFLDGVKRTDYNDCNSK